VELAGRSNALLLCLFYAATARTAQAAHEPLANSLSVYFIGRIQRQHIDRRLGMLSRMIGSPGLSRVQVLVTGTLCLYMWAQSIAAAAPDGAAVAAPTLVQTYSSADIPIPTTPIRSAPTNAEGRWVVSSGPVLLFGMVAVGVIVAAISVRIVCRSAPPKDASTHSAQTSQTKRRTAYETGNNIELKSSLPQDMYPSL
jgi:hypothetical protein